MQKLLSIGVVLLLCGCAHNAVKFPDATTPAVAAAVPAPLASGGAIFHVATFRPLFEDLRARFPGDSLIISLSERTSASNSTADNASRTASMTSAIPSVTGLPLGALRGINLEANGATKMDNKDGAKTDNLFTGTITVTVSEVLVNGNLRVAGEKQVGINDTVDTLRFSGIVSPSTIQPGNTVASAQVAEARIETISRGNLDNARVAGFLSRFFLSFLPFR